MRPGLMLIMRSVAEAAGITTADLMEGGRRAELCHARAAVHKLAAGYGYPREEIMYFLDRDRTVAYNYEANLNGHLLRNADFKALCDAATDLLNNHPHRVEKSGLRPSGEPAEPADGAPGMGEPEFTGWKGRLGWSFTAEECRREWYAVRAAAEFMKSYGTIKSQTDRQ